jgi:hypothetical protein
MRRFLTFIPFVLLFLFFAPKQLKSQVVTEIDSISMCYKAYTSVPVVVQNMADVDSLRLVLSFNNTVIDFVEAYGLNDALLGGSFSVIPENDSIIINWARLNSTTLANDTLLWLRFTGLIGSTSLHWIESGSFYHSTTGNLLTVFVDGKAVVDPQLNVLLTELSPTCAKTCDANYQAEASGGTVPYTYYWNNKLSQWDFIQKYLCSGPNKISIVDSWGCRLDSIFDIKGLPGANVKLIIEGNEDTTIYLQNPVLTFSFQENFPTHVVDPPYWEFGDGDTARSFNPTHIYDKAINNLDGYYDLKLHVVNENGCDSTIEVRIPIKEAKLNIPGVITPNGDSYNENFLIVNENKSGSGEDRKVTNEFQSMELVIFDRWGRKLYENSNYKSDWHAEGVPDGSYYYILKTIGFYKTEKYKGSITILGSGLNQ